MTGKEAIVQRIIKPLLAAAAAAAVLSGCATYDYGYSDGYYGYARPYYGYAYGGPYYYDNGPYYYDYGYGPGYYVVPPAVGFDFRFRDRDRRDRGERQHRNSRNDRHFSQRGSTNVRPAPTAQRNRPSITDNRARMAAQRPAQGATAPIARSDRGDAGRNARAQQRQALRADQQ